GLRAQVRDKTAGSNSSWPAEAEELRAVRGRKRYGLVGAVVGDAGGIRDPTCRRGQSAGLFQRETGLVSRWPRNYYITAGAKHRKRGKSREVGAGNVRGHLVARRRELATRI